MTDKGLDVVDKYDLEVRQVSRGRGVQVLHTDKGLYVLKEYKGSGSYIREEAAMLDSVNASGKIAVDTYIADLEGSYINTSSDGQRYIIKQWYELRDCDVRNFGDVIMSVRALAILHNELEKCAPEDFGRKAPDPGEDMTRHNAEIWRVRKYVTGRNNRNEFEMLAGTWCDFFYEEGMRAITEYNNMRENMNVSTGVCHGTYNHHNVCYGYKVPVIINCERMNYGYLISDLYCIMRKLMEKYDWDIKLAYRFITEYDKIRTLNDDDIKLLGVMFTFPEKFWKLINAYNNSRKTWIPARSTDKLKKVIEQNGKRLDFINTLY